MDETLKRLLGHQFLSDDLLQTALTHRSLTVNGLISYERLEFLGDRVLGFVIASMLVKAFPLEEEGALSKRHADLVRRDTLAVVARGIGIGPHIRMSRGEEETGGRENEAILADVCEAIIAALFEDGGIDAACQFINRHWAERLHSSKLPPEDAKTQLQEWAQGLGLPLPDYKIICREGPDHAPNFTVMVQVKGWPEVEGKGTSKRTAERAAAQLLLDKVK